MFIDPITLSHTLIWIVKYMPSVRFIGQLVERMIKLIFAGKRNRRETERELREDYLRKCEIDQKNRELDQKDRELDIRERECEIHNRVSEMQMQPTRIEEEPLVRTRIATEDVEEIGEIDVDLSELEEG